MKSLLIMLALVFACPRQAAAQASFPTPDNTNVAGAAALVPCGPIVNGQVAMCPPGPANGLPVVCTNCSPSAPTGASSNPVNGTIATTNTFQVLAASNAARKGCVFQNQGTHTMYFSVAPTPTLSNSLQLPPLWIYTCAGTSSTVITDTISVTGTSGDAFAGQWQ